jgi:hypothetical protein
MPSEILSVTCPAQIANQGNGHWTKLRAMSASNDPNEPAFLRRRAREFRAAAANVVDPDMADLMLNIADMYDEEAEARERGNAAHRQ